MTTMKKGFDNDLYMRKQKEHIMERISQFNGKLYLEFGGKLFDDYHAARVLPGFEPDAKIRLLRSMADQAEIIFCISAGNIEKNKLRADLGISYDQDLIRQISIVRSMGIQVNSVVITRYTGQAAADQFKQKLDALGITNYFHHPIAGYPADVDHIVSDEGYGANPYIETTKPLVVVTAPGPGSGKMAVCLSQLYNEHRHGVEAGYAKFETFPVWNLPLKHPVNIAYEAATADLNDLNMIDPFHLEAYNQIAVNYNRDVEIFPVLDALFRGIYGTNPYKSPTDMGVNMVGFCISDDELCRQASYDEIIRRYYDATNRFAMGADNEEEVRKIKMLFGQAQISTDTRKVTVVAKQRRDESGQPSAAIELQDGTMITSTSSPLLGPSAALILNATKHLAGIDQEVKLIPQNMIEPIQKTKTTYLGGHNPRLHTDEVLVALSVLSQQDENCRRALEQLPALRGCQVHSTVMLSEVDHKIFKRLGVGLSCEPVRKR